MAYVISDDCIACGTCIDECPVGAISEGDKYSIDPEACTECGTCATSHSTNQLTKTSTWKHNLLPFSDKKHLSANSFLLLSQNCPLQC